MSRLARQFELAGFVLNAGSSVRIEAQGPRDRLARWTALVRTGLPANVRIEEWFEEPVEPVPGDAPPFDIRESDPDAEYLFVPPDVATCQDCLAEMRDPSNRRFGYPFVHCAACGPRWSVIDRLPYDRDRTTLADFSLCTDCRREYEDPSNRRFHAQTMSCQACGPRLSLWTAAPVGSAPVRVADGRDALARAVAMLQQGKILAVKGTGGYQLWTMASDEAAVSRLRQRKARPRKPFAVMAPDLDRAGQLCQISSDERALLASPAAPIVILQRRSGDAPPAIAPSVAPHNPDLGMMLPSCPLQSLLLDRLDSPVVATSGNLSGEPIAFDDSEALARLSGIADGWLAHNRRILRPLDDSIARMVLGDTQVLRLGRGYAPAVLDARVAGPPVVAYGGDLKSAIGLAAHGKWFVSQHLGELGPQASLSNYERSLQDLCGVLRVGGEIVHARDLHPDYLSGGYAPRNALGVQHHVAHALSCLAENGVSGAALAIVWDGTGYGTDGTIWGGEFLRIAEDRSFERAGSILPFDLLGGEAAIRDPRRVAFALAGCDTALAGIAAAEAQGWSRLAGCAPFSPRTSSIGRLFDGISALIALHSGHFSAPTFEGECAMELEFLARRAGGEADPSGKILYPMPVCASSAPPLRLDWRPLVRAVRADLDGGLAPETVAARFHRSLIQASVELVAREDVHGGIRNVLISGGCFQNRLLIEGLVPQLEARGFLVHWQRQIPTNDGGLALGQLLAPRPRTEEAQPCAWEFQAASNR